MKLIVLFALTVAFCHGSSAVSISSSLLNKLQSKGFSEAIIVLKKNVHHIVDGINSRVWINSVEKTIAMVAELRSFTEASQTPIVNFLTQANSSTIKTFWITNRIYVSNLDTPTLHELVGTFTKAIEQIRPPYVAYFNHTVDRHDNLPQTLEWGVKNIEAPVLWEAGIEGEGIVVSHIDTGVSHTHECLVGALRETHNWLDPYFSTSEPSDEQGHGTHTMGSLVGRGGTGVAPKATYITCKGCGTESCTEEALLSCGEFTTCPTLPDGTGEDCSKKPHISSNSWGGPGGDDFYNDVIACWHAANIIPVFAAGNEGGEINYCRTINSPADQPNVIAVGATSTSNQMSYFSSMGPTMDGRIQPDVSAPGSNVRSASHLDDTLYVIMSGTSMATPHVAGAIALLLSKDNSLSFNQLDTLFKENSFRPNITHFTCTQGVNNTYPWPNNMQGWGKIDVSLVANAL